MGSFSWGCRLDRRGRLDARARERARSCSSSVWCVAAQVCRCRPVHVGEGVGEHTAAWAVCMAGVSRSTWVVRRRRDRTQRPIPTRKTSPLGRSSRSLRLSRRAYCSPAPRTPRNRSRTYTHRPSPLCAARVRACAWMAGISLNLAG